MQDFAKLNPQIALGPLDGRYRESVAPLTNYLSEAALNRARIKVEIEWLIFLIQEKVLAGAPTLNTKQIAYLHNLVEDFGAENIAELKEIEQETRHDVKAVEYYLKRKLTAGVEILENAHLENLKEIVHIFCTSEDINNLCQALMVRDAIKEIWLPQAQKFVAELTELAISQSKQPMLSRTHGQTATPTTLGKEIGVFVYRLKRQLKRIENTEFLGKLNGATGTFGAHAVSVPTANWLKLSEKFVTNLGLSWNPLTTQIESHDWMGELFADIARFNRISHNLATDFWTYISLGYFQQNLKAQGSTGSSTMPHKVNPIRFENAEANMEISCALLDSLSATLVTSRMQRDLTDSSTQRNIGVALGHSLLAIENLQRGIAGLDINATRLAQDLATAWEVLGEPIQQAMRVAAISGAQGMADPYERLKELTRGRQVTAEDMQKFIKELGIPKEVETKLLALTPETYIGLAPKLLEFIK